MSRPTREVAGKLYYVDPNDLVLLPCNPTNRTDVKNAGFKSFCKHLDERGQIEPIIATEDGWVVADGNRRVCASRELNRKVLTMFVPGNAAEIFGTINYWRKAIIGKARLEAILKDLNVVPAPMKRDVESITSMIGWDGLNRVFEHGGSLNTCIESKKLISKLQNELATIDVILWVVINKFSSRVRQIVDKLEDDPANVVKLGEVIKADLVFNGIELTPLHNQQNADGGK